MIVVLIHAQTEEHVLMELIHFPVSVLLDTLALTATPVSMRVLFRLGVAISTTDVCQQNKNCSMGIFIWILVDFRMGAKGNENVLFALCFFNS